MPTFPHSKAYIEDRKARRLPRALAQGTARMRAEAEGGNYMWPRPGELRPAYGEDDGTAASTFGGSSLSLYAARVRESTIRNVWLDAITRGALAPFRHQILLEGYGPKIMSWSGQFDENQMAEESIERDWRGIDGAGRSLQQYMMEPALEQAVDGIHFTLVDLPEVRDESGTPLLRSRADDDEAGLRPFWVPILADHFDPLVVEYTSGGATLRRCAFYMEESERESAERPEQDSESSRGFWRVYDLAGSGEVKTYDVALAKPDLDAEVDVKNSGPWLTITPLGGGVLGEIPVRPFYGDFWGRPYRARPPFAEPAENQAGAWRKRSHKDELARRSARSRTFQSGVDLDTDGNPRQQLITDYLYSSDPGADAKIVETTGRALSRLREDLHDDEDYIARACRSVVAHRAYGRVTATEAGIMGLEASSHTEAVIVGNAMTIQSTLELTERVAGLSPSGGRVHWRHDLLSPIRAEALKAAAELVKAGKMSLEGYDEMQKKAGGHPQDWDIQAELRRLAGGRDEPPTGVPPGLDDEDDDE